MTRRALLIVSLLLVFATAPAVAGLEGPRPLDPPIGVSPACNPYQNPHAYVGPGSGSLTPPGAAGMRPTIPGFDPAADCAHAGVDINGDGESDVPVLIPTQDGDEELAVMSGFFPVDHHDRDFLVNDTLGSPIMFTVGVDGDRSGIIGDSPADCAQRFVSAGRTDCDGRRGGGWWVFLHIEASPPTFGEIWSGWGGERPSSVAAVAGVATIIINWDTGNAPVFTTPAGWYCSTSVQYVLVPYAIATCDPPNFMWNDWKCQNPWVSVNVVPVSNPGTGTSVRGENDCGDPNGTPAHVECTGDATTPCIDWAWQTSGPPMQMRCGAWPYYPPDLVTLVVECSNDP